MSKFARQAQTTEHSPDLPPSAPDERAADRAVAVMAEVLAFNGSSQAHEDLWSDTRQATDIVNQAAADLAAREKKVGDAELAYQAERAKQLDRSAPRPRQWLLAAAALSLDGVACVFAAEALDGSAGDVRRPLSGTGGAGTIATRPIRTTSLIRTSPGKRCGSSRTGRRGPRWIWAGEGGSATR